jgi:hypothetical protein
VYRRRKKKHHLLTPFKQITRLNIPYLLKKKKKKEEKKKKEKRRKKKKPINLLFYIKQNYSKD